MHAKFFRMDGKFLRMHADVLLQDDSAAQMLSRTRFMHTFFFRVMQEEKSKDAFPFGEIHQPTILLAISAFVLKRRAVVRTQAGFIHDDVPIVPSEVVDMENEKAEIALNG